MISVLVARVWCRSRSRSREFVLGLCLHSLEVLVSRLTSPEEGSPSRRRRSMAGHGYAQEEILRDRRSTMNHRTTDQQLTTTPRCCLYFEAQIYTLSAANTQKHSAERICPPRYSNQSRFLRITVFMASKFIISKTILSRHIEVSTVQLPGIRRHATRRPTS